MTPNEMLTTLQGYGIRCEIVNTGGNCGAISVEVPYGELFVTTESGPWATPADDDYDRAERWAMCWYDSEGTWVDGDLVRDEFALWSEDRVPVALARLQGFAMAHDVP